MQNWATSLWSSLMFYVNLGKGFDWMGPPAAETKDKDTEWEEVMRRPVIFCSFSLSGEPAKHTSELHFWGAARLKVGGSGLQTMSNIWEQ